MRITETVKQLIIINIIFFVASNYFVNTGLAYDYLALHMPTSDKFQVWQLVTHMFMHGGLLHIFFNMFALFSFGVFLEHLWGTKKFLFFYFSCGLGAALLHLGVAYFQLQNVLEQVSYLNLSDSAIHQIINLDIYNAEDYNSFFLNEVNSIINGAGKTVALSPEAYQTLFYATELNHSAAVGASGAIYGVLVAFAFMFPNVELMLMFIPVPIKAKYFVPVLVAIDLYLGVTGKSIFGGGGGVAHFAHVGGALIGFIMMWYWKKNQFNNNRWN